MNQILALQQLTVDEGEEGLWPPCFSFHQSFLTNPSTTTE